MFFLYVTIWVLLGFASEILLNKLENYDTKHQPDYEEWANSVALGSAMGGFTTAILIISVFFKFIMPFFYDKFRKLNILKKMYNTIYNVKEEKE